MNWLEGDDDGCDEPESGRRVGDMRTLYIAEVLVTPLRMIDVLGGYLPLRVPIPWMSAQRVHPGAIEAPPFISPPPALSSASC